MPWIPSLPASHDAAQEVVDVLTKILDQTIQKDKQQRISAWKQKLRKSEVQQYQ